MKIIELILGIGVFLLLWRVLEWKPGRKP